MRIKWQTNISDTNVDVYCRPPDQEKEFDKVFHRQLKVASQSEALVLMGDLNHANIYRNSDTARCT